MMSNTNFTAMERYIAFSETTDRWEVNVPINWSGLQKTESVGGYATKSEAELALKTFYAGLAHASFFDSLLLLRSPPPSALPLSLSPYQVRTEAADQTIKALRLHVAALEKERNGLKDDLTSKNKIFLALRSNYLTLASNSDGNAWNEAQDILRAIEENKVAYNGKMRECTPPPLPPLSPRAAPGGGGGGDGSMGWDDYEDPPYIPSVRGYMSSLNGYDT